MFEQRLIILVSLAVAVRFWGWTEVRCCVLVTVQLWISGVGSWGIGLCFSVVFRPGLHLWCRTWVQLV